MKKDDLKTGMVVKLRDGSLNIVLKDSIYKEDIIVDFCCDRGYMSLTQYDDNLMCSVSDSGDLDIMEVFKPEIYPGNADTSNRIWKRPKKRMVTMEELKEIFGCDVEIITSNMGG